MHPAALLLILVSGCGVAFVGESGGGGRDGADSGSPTGTPSASPTGSSTGTPTGPGSTSSSTGVGGAGGDPTGVGGAGGAGGKVPPEWVVVETLTVPVDGSTISSSTVLASTGTYRLRASGTFTISTTANILADAEYYDFSAPPGSVIDGGSLVDHGLAVDDTTVDLDRSPKWGTYDASHVYVVDFPGKDATIVAQFHDEVPSNNEGSLTLEILSLQ